MDITFAPKGILQINDARIIYRNLRGEGSKFNRAGDRNFSVVIPDRSITPEEMYNIKDVFKEADIVDADGQELLLIDDNPIKTLADALTAMTWNVKIKPAREEGDDLFMHLPVKVAFNDRGPNIYLVTDGEKNRLDKESVAIIDDIDILTVNLDIRPYDWEVNGDTGRSAYLIGMEVHQQITDRFAER